jgi:hypothetical protein
LDRSDRRIEKLHNMEFHNLCASSNTVRMIGVGHATHIREMRNACKILVRKPEKGNHLKDLGIDGKVVLKWIITR